MVCDCCRKRKKLLESFASVDTTKGKMNLCVICNDLAYKIRDDAENKDLESFMKHIGELEKREKRAKPVFVGWKKGFIKELKNVYFDE